MPWASRDILSLRMVQGTPEQISGLCPIYDYNPSRGSSLPSNVLGNRVGRAQRSKPRMMVAGEQTGLLFSRSENISLEMGWIPEVLEQLHSDGLGALCTWGVLPRSGAVLSPLHVTGPAAALERMFVARPTLRLSCW